MMGELSLAVRRASGLTKQLLTFARGGAPVRATVDLVEIVRDTARLVTRGTMIRLQHELPEQALALADAAQMAQVVSNLVINARQAQHDTGDLTVRLLPVEIGEPAWRIEVEDAGPGVPDAHLARLFDPYFSTKPGGKGLGLAVCDSIVRQHGGTITASSQPKGGTLFAVTVPVGDTATCSVQTTRPPPPMTTPSVVGRVLVMDDEDEVRSVLVHCLESMGCEVAAVPEGEAACHTYESAMRNGQRFDFVLLDLTVPNGWGGLRTLEQLRLIDPDVCAAVISGYAADGTMAKAHELGFAGRLSKPFGMDELRLLLSTLDEWATQGRRHG
jgi:CheY-like chemotaxis protein/anti-sigma regulatory factor (Ser/Thr protein kinase)